MVQFLIFAVPGGMELIIIFLIVLLLFGAKKLPEVARGLGGSIREFKKATKGIQDEIKNTVDDELEIEDEEPETENKNSKEKPNRGNADSPE